MCVCVFVNREQLEFVTGSIDLEAIVKAREEWKGSWSGL
jgi:hypothetical protein